jgi:hypothetical protein
MDQLQKLITSAAVAAASAAATTAMKKQTLSEKTPDVQEYTGKGGSAALEAFRTALRMKFAVNSDRYTTPVARVSYLLTRLRGDAQELLQSQLHSPSSFADWEEALSTLGRTFDDPDPEFTATQNLLRLRQGNRPFAEFYQEFQRHSRRLPSEPVLQKQILRLALSRELTQQLSNQDIRQFTLEQLVEECRRLDPIARNRPPVWTPRAPPTGMRTTTTPLAARAPVPARAPSPPNDPMDLDSKQLERQRRRRNGLCFYCGEAGHVAAECPSLKSKTKPSVTGTPAARPQTDDAATAVEEIAWSEEDF